MIDGIGRRFFCRGLFILVFIPQFLISLGAEQLQFSDFFLDRTLRVDYFQTGTADEMVISIDRLYQEGQWAGNPRNLIDDLDFGNFYVKIYEISSNKLIYSRGFGTIFGEYRTTEKARKGEYGSFHQTILTPFPLRPVLLVIEARNRQNLLQPVFSRQIDPKDPNIIKELPDPSDMVFEIQRNGPPHDQVDLLFVGEGFTSLDAEKFRGDIQRYTDELFKVEPFQSHRQRFNVTGILKPSPESCVDEPTKGIYKRTVVDASFNALGTPRYLLINNNKSLRDIASKIPYDSVVVIANCSRYGGGGIYNDYMIFTSDNERSPQTFLHEWGHAFANLADEYYSSSVAYTDFFPPGVEPHEPNITALLDPENVKWKHHLSPGIEIPTDWGQDQVEGLRNQIRQLQTRIDSIAAGGENSGPAKTRTELQDQILALRKDIESIQDQYRTRYEGKVGVFEGAGYTAKGLYRSEIHIGMFYNGEYGPVSEEAIVRIIRFLSE